MEENKTYYGQCGSIAFQLGGEEHRLGPAGILWFLFETLNTLASKCTDILRASKKEQEDCSENAR